MMVNVLSWIPKLYLLFFSPAHFKTSENIRFKAFLNLKYDDLKYTPESQ